MISAREVSTTPSCLQLCLCLVLTFPNAREQPRTPSDLKSNRSARGLVSPAAQVPCHLLCPPRDFKPGKEILPAQSLWGCEHTVSSAEEAPVDSKLVLVMPSATGRSLDGCSR